MKLPLHKHRTERAGAGEPVTGAAGKAGFIRAPAA